MKTSEKVATVLDNGFVRVTTLIAAVIFCGGAILKANRYLNADALWKQSIARDIQDVSEERKADSARVASVEKELQRLREESLIMTGEKWSRSAMRNWVESTADKNPGWLPARVESPQ